MHIFGEVLFFKPCTKKTTTKNNQPEKQTTDLIYLVSVRCGRLAEGKRPIVVLKSILLISCVFRTFFLSTGIQFCFSFFFSTSRQTEQKLNYMAEIFYCLKLKKTKQLKSTSNYKLGRIPWLSTAGTCCHNSSISCKIWSLRSAKLQL